jgi:hypothetical protein
VEPPDAPVPTAEERQALEAFAQRIRPWIEAAARGNGLLR